MQIIRKYLAVLILIMAGLGLFACEHEPVNTTSTTIEQTTTTTTFPENTDSTVVLQSLLSSGYLYVNQTYVVDGTLIPPSGSIIEFGPSGRFIRSDGVSLGGPVLRLQNGNVTLKNVRIYGSNECFWDVPTWWQNTSALGFKYAQYDPKREFAHGIDIQGGTGYVIDNPVVHDVWGDGINIDTKSLNNPTKDVTITNIDVQCVGRSVVSNTGSERVSITGGTGSGAFYWIFNIEPYNKQVVKNYTVSGVNVGFSRVPWLFSGGPYFNCSGVIGVDLRGNILRPEATSPPQIRDCVANEIRY